jgi:flagellar biosynthesis GTPase FlhF
VCFRHYDSADAIRKEINLFQQNAISAFRSYVDDAITKVKSAAVEVRPAARADADAQRAPASATQSAPSEASQATPARQSLKRHVSTDTLNEMSPAKISRSKKARNDRLLKAIKAAQGTIQDMAVQRVEEQDVMELDEFGVGGVSIFA